MAEAGGGSLATTAGQSRQAPFAAQNAHEVKMLVQSLEANKTTGHIKKGSKKGFTCKKTAYDLPQLGGREVNSWKMNDWDYKRDDLPTYARGLFTYNLSDGTPQIAVRGYDKFFNISEVNETRWEAIESHTRGPYELSNKENGCIIFIAGLENDEIIVCSKHSTGERGDVNANHSIQGLKWLDRHLAAVGRTRQQLARELRSRNATLVAELCDDAFEEHVLEYGSDDAGLYVHGINLNVPEFATYPFHLVEQFADEWGLRKAKFVIRDTVSETRTFLEQCGETGSWNGRDTEGFVIRCQKKAGNSWVDWFFKYKYEEPYLMYRQWREATKAIISGRQPKYKKHAKITEDYLKYAKQQLLLHPQLAQNYQKNHGIIAMREGFLKQQGVKGSDIIRAEEDAEDPDGATTNTTRDVVLVPISTIGCGKTTIANALVSLFGFGHVQNDNITGQKGRPAKFAGLLIEALRSHPAVIADRNNHVRRERRQIMDDVSKVLPTARYVALHYVHHPKGQMVPRVREVTVARVKGRGDNHQTIRASSKDSKEIEAIMDGFLDRFEPPSDDTEPDNNFDEIIDMDPREDSRHNLEIVVSALHKSFPKLVPQIPPAEDMDKAIEASLNDYSPQLQHDLSFGRGGKNDRDARRTEKRETKTRTKDRKVEYFAIRLSSQQIIDALDQVFENISDPAQAAFYRQLQQTGRVQAKFHVTLIHSASARSDSGIWKNYEERHKAALTNGGGGSRHELDPYLGPATVQLDRVVWDDRVMSVVVHILNDEWLCANAVPHITVGTATPDIKPRESNDLLARWQEGGVNAVGIRQLDLVDSTNTNMNTIQQQLLLHGDVRAVTPATR